MKKLLLLITILLSSNSSFSFPIESNKCKDSCSFSKKINILIGHKYEVRENADQICYVVIIARSSLLENRRLIGIVIFKNQLNTVDNWDLHGKYIDDLTVNARDLVKDLGRYSGKID